MLDNEHNQLRLSTQTIGLKPVMRKPIFVIFNENPIKIILCLIENSFEETHFQIQYLNIHLIQLHNDKISHCIHSRFVPYRL